SGRRPRCAARGPRAGRQSSATPPRGHAEDWESSAVQRGAERRKQVFGDSPKLPRPAAQLGKTERSEGGTTTPLVLHPEPDLPLHAVLKSKQEVTGKSPACVLLHLDGKAEALKHPLAAALVNKGWTVIAPQLRATGEMQPPNDKIRDAPDHNSA